MNTRKQIQFDQGIDEVPVLKAAMAKAMVPLLNHLNETESACGDGFFKLSWSEYKSRDGFIPHSDNYGGPMIESVIPNCMESDFPMLSFPEYSYDKNLNEEENEECRQNDEGDGYLDSYLRVWFKYEGCDEKGMTFYLNVSTCDEAPYFRLKYSKDLFEGEFKAKNITEFKAKAKKIIQKAIKKLGGK